MNNSLFTSIDLDDFSEIEIPSGNETEINLGQVGTTTTPTEKKEEVETPQIGNEEEQKELEDPELIVLPDEEEDIKEQEKTSDINLTPYAAALVEGGVLPSLDIEKFKELDGEAQYEAINESINSRVEEGVKQYFDEMPQDLKEIILNYQEGVPLDLTVKKRNTEIEYNKITDEELLENEALMDRIIKEDRLNSGDTEEEALEYIENLADKGKAAKLSKRRNIRFQATQVEQRKEQEKIQRQQQEQERTRMINEYKELTNTIDEIIPGVKISNQERERMFKGGTRSDKNVYTLDKFFEKDKLRAEATINYLLDVTNGFTDWSKITKQTKTSVTRDLLKNIEAETAKRSTIAGSIDRTSKGSVVAELQKQFGNK